jgi:GMP reductase
MRIENDIKLDFKDVLILPKRSKLSSRSQVSLERNYKFINSKREWSGVPIMISNMDTTGTFEIAKEMIKHKVITCLHKFYSVDDWKEFVNTLDDDSFNFIVVSIGITENDINKLDEIMKIDSRLYWICIDVANGYTENFIETVRNIRKNILIML